MYAYHGHDRIFIHIHVQSWILVCAFFANKRIFYILMSYPSRVLLFWVRYLYFHVAINGEIYRNPICVPTQIIYYWNKLDLNRMWWTQRIHISNSTIELRIDWLIDTTITPPRHQDNLKCNFRNLDVQGRL